MNRKKMATLVIVGSMTATLLTAMFASGSFLQLKDVVLTIQSDKDNIYVGEAVSLKFEFRNQGPTAVRIPVDGVLGGNIEIYVGKKGEPFRKYFRSDWGRLDEEANFLNLEPGQKKVTDSSQAKLLWNGKPDYSHLNETAARLADKQDNRILTDYAFPAAGVYLVKATSCLFDELNRCSIPVESEPIQIKVNEPVGDDLQVWNQIKGNRQIALLMQGSGFDTRDETKKQELISEVDQILVEHPNSIYSNYLGPNLEQFKRNEAKRKEMLEKMLIRPKN